MPHLREKHQTRHNQQHKHTNSQQSKISRSHLRLVTIIHNAHQINRNQSQTSHHAIYNQPYGPPAATMIRLYKTFVRPLFDYGHIATITRIIQKHKHLGRHLIQIHQKHPPSSPHIPRKCRQIWELTIHQTSPSTPF